MHYKPLRAKRYTEKALQADLEVLNKALAEKGHGLRFQWGSSYGRSDVNLATPEQMEQHCCQRRLHAGTPKECLQAAEHYIATLLLSENFA